jgi:hypothetical protein
MALRTATCSRGGIPASSADASGCTTTAQATRRLYQKSHINVAGRGDDQPIRPTSTGPEVGIARSSMDVIDCIRPLVGG